MPALEVVERPGDDVPCDVGLAQPGLVGNEEAARGVLVQEQARNAWSAVARWKSLSAAVSPLRVPSVMS